LNQLEKEVLYLLRESRKDKMNVNNIAAKLKKDSQKIIFTLGILADNNLVEVEKNSSGKIKRAKITDLGTMEFKESTKIVSKESVKEQISEIRNRLISLEMAFENFEKNPTEDNKKGFMEQLDTWQSVANGLAPWVKTGLDIFMK
jgi:hypothetical protein